MPPSLGLAFRRVALPPTRSRPTSCRNGAARPAPAGPEGEYLRALHAHIHRRWADKFLRLVGGEAAAREPAERGEADRRGRHRRRARRAADLGAHQPRSGFPGFDDAILEVLRDAVPFPKPPHERALGRRAAARALGVRARSAALRRAGRAAAYDPVEVALPKLLQRRPARRGAAAASRWPAAPACPPTPASPRWRPTGSRPRSTSRGRRCAWPGCSPRAATTKAASGSRTPSADPSWRPTRRRAGRRQGAALPPAQGLVRERRLDRSPAGRPRAGDLRRSGLRARPGEAAPEHEGPPEGARRRGDRAGLDNDADDARRRSPPPPRRTTPSRRCARRRCWPRSSPTRAGQGHRDGEFLRDPAPEMRAAAAAGVVRAGGTTDLDDLRAVQGQRRAARAGGAARAERVPSEKATEADRAARAAAPARGAEAGGRDADPPQRPRLLLGVEAAVSSRRPIPSCARWRWRAPRRRAAEGGRRPEAWARPFRARLARGEREQATDWFLARGAKPCSRTCRRKR